jgi:hypothetical protein
MDATHLTTLLRSLATSPSRRAVARALTGFALAGVLFPVVGLTETDAKRNKKKRRRKKRRKKEQPFCAGKNYCTGDSSGCGTGAIGFECACLVTAEAGDPFCAEAWTLTLDCDACSQGETCVALGGEGLGCDSEIACATPCADPL